jgi:hypothetical protein
LEWHRPPPSNDGTALADVSESGIWAMAAGTPNDAAAPSTSAAAARTIIKSMLTVTSET